jgi:hypothetical protein
MQKDFSMVMGNKLDVVTKLYVGHLPGYRRYHALTDGRSQDTLFSPNGGAELTVTGTRAGPAVYSDSYGRFQPGLRIREIISFFRSRKGCD